MKYLFFLIVIFFTKPCLTQTNLPEFLKGSWKIENQETYEHWDKLNEQSLKGLSYTIQDDRIVVTEYLDITLRDNTIYYTATVLNQNEGKGVPFRMTNSDSTFIFENPDHDFPKIISYHPQSDSEIQVTISDGKDKTISHRLLKLNTPPAHQDSSVTNPQYDAALAQKLGADDYGMKGFILVLLKTGPNQTSDQDVISQSFRGHMTNINRLVEEGKLIVAGPMKKNDKTYRGNFILDVSSSEEAKTLLETDPAIQAGLLDFELYEWYGSAALPSYLEDSEKVWKIQP